MARILKVCLFGAVLSAAVPALAQQPVLNAFPGFNAGHFFGRAPGPRVNAINQARGFGLFGGFAGAGGLNNWGGMNLWSQSPTAYYDLNWDERVPYFAMHPPVYYSAPIPRTYGYSPFAYPGEVPTPELQTAPPPATIINPYAQPEAQPTAARDETTTLPLRIRNPYVESNIADDSADVPKVVAQTPADRVR